MLVSKRFEFSKWNYIRHTCTMLININITVLTEINQRWCSVESTAAVFTNLKGNLYTVHVCFGWQFYHSNRSSCCNIHEEDDVRLNQRFHTWANVNNTSTTWQCFCNICSLPYHANSVLWHESRTAKMTFSMHVARRAIIYMNYEGTCSMVLAYENSVSFSRKMVWCSRKCDNV